MERVFRVRVRNRIYFNVYSFELGGCIFIKGDIFFIVFN